MLGLGLFEYDVRYGVVRLIFVEFIGKLGGGGRCFVFKRSRVFFM